MRLPHVASNSAKTRVKRVPGDAPLPTQQKGCYFWKYWSNGVRKGKLKKTVLIMSNSPGLGHLIPVQELGKRLLTLNFKVTIFVDSSQTSAAESQVIESFTSLNRCEVILLPPPDISHLVDHDAAVVTRLAVLMRETRPAFSSALSALSFAPTVLIVDLFGCEHMEVADEFKIQKLVYISSQAWFLALTLYLPILHESVKGEYVDEKNALFIPGCKPLLPEDVVDSIGGLLSNEQMRELALGLELSQQRFIWVVRPPAESNDGSFFTVGNSGNADEGVASYLPEGGWNSTLESIINGVALIAWPLYTEQRMNATLLAEEVRIAVRPKTSPWKGIVGREEIKMMVKVLMVDEEGHAMRGRVRELKSSGQ
ncbi:Anthocyanidin 3-O-glucosyltransferase 5 [Hibiscus syriacus]|uniref:Anthocyanidin 3-O-glucosyltransferase 5 n=1 Tax=Hibiscus syriacus TaxID=106335 RepID=A0A6A2ZYF2_HIBSY|nr:Anthocyanidin 3-O-glucosyltransferase 5 [Hibiscus syriacus]